MRQISCESVASMYKPFLLRKPYVSAIGVGEKNGRPVVQVFVCRELPDYGLKDSDIIPQMLDGFETDVVVLRGVAHSSADV